MADLGLGSTFDGFSPDLDFSKTIATTTDPRRALIVDLARRFTYTRGHWPRSPDRGFDLWELLNASGVTASFIQSRCREQCLQDERVEDASVVVSPKDEGTGYRIEISVTALDGPFTFIISYPDLTVELLNEV